MWHGGFFGVVEKCSLFATLDSQQRQKRMNAKNAEVKTIRAADNNALDAIVHRKFVRCEVN